MVISKWVETFQCTSGVRIRFLGQTGFLVDPLAGFVHGLYQDLLQDYINPHAGQRDSPTVGPRTLLDFTKSNTCQPNTSTEVSLRRKVVKKHSSSFQMNHL